MRRGLECVCLALGAWLLLSGCSDKSSTTTPQPGKGEGDRPGRFGPPTMRRDTTVYVVDVDKGCLVPVSVELPDGGVEEQIRAVVGAVAAAEESDSLVRCIPAGSALRNVAVQSGTAVLDFERGFTDPGFWSGSGTESLRVWGLVNAVTELKDIRKVRILSEGEPIESLGGHVELTEPLARDENLIGDK